MSLTAQLLANAFEVRAPAVAQDDVVALQLDAGQQLRIAAKRQRQFLTEGLLERVAHLARLLLAQRGRRHHLDRTTARGRGGKAAARFRRQLADLVAERGQKRVQREVRRQALEQAPCDVDGKRARMIDDLLFRRGAVARDRRFGFAAQLGDVLRGLLQQLGLFRLRRFLRFGEQPVPLGGDFGAGFFGLAARGGGLLAGRFGVGEQLVRLFLALGDDVRYRPKEEPRENPDENEDIDGLERQRPPVECAWANE